MALCILEVHSTTQLQHSLSIRSDEGLALETSAIVSFTAFHYPHQHTVDTPVYNILYWRTSRVAFMLAGV